MLDYELPSDKGVYIKPHGTMQWVLVEYEVRHVGNTCMAYYMGCDGWSDNVAILNATLKVRNSWLFQTDDLNRSTRDRVYRVKRAPCWITPFDVNLYRGELVKDKRSIW